MTDVELERLKDQLDIATMALLSLAKRGDMLAIDTLDLMGVTASQSPSPCDEDSDPGSS